jgi:hypothetical protein
MHGDYQRIGGAMLAHSADYAPGSSGGGAFLSNGHLVGIVPYGASPSGISRSRSYGGIGLLYSVEAICRESGMLRAAGVCQDLAR